MKLQPSPVMLSLLLTYDTSTQGIKVNLTAQEAVGFATASCQGRIPVGTNEVTGLTELAYLERHPDLAQTSRLALHPCPPPVRERRCSHAQCRREHDQHAPVALQPS